MFFVFDSIPDQYKTQEIYNNLFLYPFFTVHCLDKCKTQRKIYDEAVNDSLAALKLIPNWFVTRVK